MHRLFVAIRPPEQIRDLLVDATDEGPGLRWVGEENLHLTLRFIGEVERPLATDIAAALAAIRYNAFDLRVQGIGRFERRSGGAVWAGVQPRDKVAELAAKIDRACVLVGLEPERRAFHPHITLARYNRSSAEEAREFERRRSNLSSPTFTIERFLLFESRLSRHGPHYERVASYALAVDV